ncbi:energy transducer TonB [Mucilaginibacter myungsuensis]|uniref:Energy transducer TonB n=1 Tax=Mucilaginibacter myungsuensis TaxID=649104 RepID=A0A929KV28_9SPHI|nr:energy transducer TonB [Mucilaginibacter myungsuensis]MBE9661292.1 energy transducer TonB [Mucilaginibacter myungsuensis]MDN3597435.1 energy transducer TonB [Mucilaginibacter myungsuensis]
MFRRIIFTIALISGAYAALAQPTFKGGEQALNKFLKEKIIYPDFASRNCISAVVHVKFRVYKDGRVDKVKVQSGPGIDLDEEAIRVVKRTAGKWTLPAGVEAATAVLPVRFTPDPSRCNSSTKLSREQAINAYHQRQEQENAVTNYYQNKHAGKADTSKEAYIISLKQQLGFDEDFIEDILAQADEKRKQGDNEGACADWKFIRNIGSIKADPLLARYCIK